MKFSKGSVTVLKKMANYEQSRVKLTNKQLNKLKSAVLYQNIVQIALTFTAFLWGIYLLVKKLKS